MEHPFYFNTNQNFGHRQKSHTLQPIRGRDLHDMTESKQFMINKYLSSLDEPEPRTNYANVPSNQNEIHPLIEMDRHQYKHIIHRHPAHPHGLHSRSQSQHYYNTMCQINDPNNYYNLSNIGTIIPRSRQPSPMHEPPAPTHHHTQLDKITMMQVCNDLGNLDSPPPMPPPRNYTVSRNQDGSCYKMMLPQRRSTKIIYTDSLTGISLQPGTVVDVLAPSKEDRSKFTICVCIDGSYKHLDMPHQLMHPPNPSTPLYPNGKVTHFHHLVSI